MSLLNSLCQFASILYGPSSDKCEDACSYSFAKDDLHYAGVFDGCGGLGSKRYELLGNRTGAFISSQTCAMVFHDEMEKKASAGPFDDTFVSDLKASFSSSLRKNEKQYGQENTLIGSMVRTLPCTGSMVIVTETPDNGRALHLNIIQAGDSRVYVMRPKEGLQQVTRDELAGDPDALKNLYVSAPMTNVINIDNDFSLTHLSFDLEMPFALLCASDGAFGYVRTPMHFEKIVLDCLETADSFGSFEKALYVTLTSITGDDTTAVMPFYGWTTFEQLKESFLKRHRFVAGLCRSVEKEMSDEMIDAAWEQYKAGYYWKGVDS